MTFRRAYRAALVLAISLAPLRAEWIKLSTPHFEMYTDNPQAKAIAALEILEDARAFFDANSPARTVTEQPIRIIAFESEKEFRAYSPNPGAVAFYQRGHRRDYIVLRDLGPGAYPIAIHEYTHLYLEHRNLHLPLWLNEGLADVYSTLQARGEQLIIGLPPAGRLEALRTLPLLDLGQLAEVKQTSPYYRDPALMRQFYSESWALAHMLLLGKTYGDAFPEFLKSVDGGKSSEASFQDVYGKTLADVARDLHDYLSPGPLPVESFDPPLDARDVPELTAFADEEAGTVLTDLLSAER